MGCAKPMFFAKHAHLYTHAPTTSTNVICLINDCSDGCTFCLIEKEGPHLPVKMDTQGGGGDD